LLVAAGWPQNVGLNDTRTTSHNRLTLDGATVHTYYTKGHGFFVFDPKLNIVTCGASRDEALLAMANRRRNLSPCAPAPSPDPSARVSISICGSRFSTPAGRKKTTEAAGTDSEAAL
jgi:hypothetical protein